MCKTLVNRGKRICEVSNICNELEHLGIVLKKNGYPRRFILNFMKTPRCVELKIEYQSSVCLSYIGPASHKIKRIVRVAGILMCPFNYFRMALAYDHDTVRI